MTRSLISAVPPPGSAIAIRRRLVGSQPDPGRQFSGEWIVSPSRWLR